MRNLDDNRILHNEIEFVLVDFGSNDGIKEWVHANCESDLRSGYLSFYTTDEMPFWHCSVAKNTAHMLAKGEIVTNLDCDNFTGPDGAEFVLKQFDLFGEKAIVHQFSGSPTDGSFGRISVYKKYFDAIGGYDEAFGPMGYQDSDLIHRLEKLGLTYIVKTDPLYTKALYNTKAESIKYTGSQDTYSDMVKKNRSISHKNIKSGNIMANTHGYGIKQNVRLYELPK